MMLKQLTTAQISLSAKRHQRTPSDIQSTAPSRDQNRRCSAHIEIGSSPAGWLQQPACISFTEGRADHALRITYHPEKKGLGNISRICNRAKSGRDKSHPNKKKTVKSDNPGTSCNI